MPSAWSLAVQRSRSVSFTSKYVWEFEMPPALIVRRDISPEELAGMAEQRRATQDMPAGSGQLPRFCRAQAASRPRTSAAWNAKPSGTGLSVTMRGGRKRFTGRSLRGRPAKLTPGQRKVLAALVLAGPASTRHELARWRLSDLATLVRQRFGVELDEVSIGRTAEVLGSDMLGQSGGCEINREL